MSNKKNFSNIYTDFMYYYIYTTEKSDKYIKTILQHNHIVERPHPQCAMQLIYFIMLLSFNLSDIEHFSFFNVSVCFKMNKLSKKIRRRGIKCKNPRNI